MLSEASNSDSGFPASEAEVEAFRLLYNRVVPESHDISVTKAGERIITKQHVGNLFNHMQQKVKKLHVDHFKPLEWKDPANNRDADAEDVCSYNLSSHLLQNLEQDYHARLRAMLLRLEDRFNVLLRNFTSEAQELAKTRVKAFLKSWQPTRSPPQKEDSESLENIVEQNLLINDISEQGIHETSSSCEPHVTSLFPMSTSNTFLFHSLYNLCDQPCLERRFRHRLKEEGVVTDRGGRVPPELISRSS